MQTLALITVALAVIAIVAGVFGLNRAQSPNAAYGAAILGVAGACALFVCLLIF